MEWLLRCRLIEYNEFHLFLVDRSYKQTLPHPYKCPRVQKSLDNSNI